MGCAACDACWHRLHSLVAKAIVSNLQLALTFFLCFCSFWIGMWPVWGLVSVLIVPSLCMGLVAAVSLTPF
jgi:hypothetical protein